LGGGDSEVIKYLKQGYSEGKQIKIYGYSRGGNAAVRITNALGAEGINVYQLTTFDPHSLSNGCLIYIIIM
jgi:thioesterase domain-containing protein